MFSGEKATNVDGTARIAVALPDLEKLMKTYVCVLVEAEGYMDRDREYDLNLPQPNERKAILIRLTPGKSIQGRIKGLDEGDNKDLWVEVNEGRGSTPKQYKDEWYDLPKVSVDGSFATELAPLVPLHVQVKHLRDKYLPFSEDLEPPFDRTLEITLQPNPDYREVGSVIFKITNPPASGKLRHRVVLYSQTKRQLLVTEYSALETSPVRKVLKEAGTYEAILISHDENEPVWAHATFTFTPPGKTEVSLTLEKAGTVCLRFREKLTGKLPTSGDFWFTLYLERDGNYQKVADLTTAKSEDKILKEGVVTFNAIPSGKLMLVVKELSGKIYKDWSSELTIATGETASVDVLLEAEGDK